MSIITDEDVVGGVTSCNTTEKCDISGIIQHLKILFEELLPSRNPVIFLETVAGWAMRIVSFSQYNPNWPKLFLCKEYTMRGFVIARQSCQFVKAGLQPDSLRNLNRAEIYDFC